MPLNFDNNHMIVSFATKVCAMRFLKKNGLEGDTLYKDGKNPGRIVWQMARVNCLTLGAMWIIIAINNHIIWRGL